MAIAVTLTLTVIGWQSLWWYLAMVGLTVVICLVIIEATDTQRPSPDPNPYRIRVMGMLRGWVAA